MTAFQALEDDDHIPSQSSPHQAENTELLQPFLIGILRTTEGFQCFQHEMCDHLLVLLASCLPVTIWE